MKSLWIAWRLLWANRWLWLLLVLWPWAMAAVMLTGGLHPAPEDVSGTCAAEPLRAGAGAFTGGALLGNEQRSRRIVLVLSRAVSRRQYLGALWLAAFLPLVAYVLDLALTGPVLGAAAVRAVADAGRAAAAEYDDGVAGRAGIAGAAGGDCRHLEPDCAQPAIAVADRAGRLRRHDCCRFC